MPANGYGAMTDKAYISFKHDLEEGAWGAISCKKHDVEGQKPKGLLELPPPVLWKLRAVWSIADLMGAIGPGAEGLQKLDDAWDASERSLAHAVAAAEDDVDQAKREAAARVRAALLSGAGTEQTTLAFDDEIDFGRKQVLMASQGSLAADIKLLGLGASMKRIDEATEVFAKGAGRGPGEKRAGTRSSKIRSALTACSATFNAIHDELSWHIDHAHDRDVRDRLEALLAPFAALLERFSAPAASAASAAPAAPAPPAAPTSPADGAPEATKEPAPVA